MSRVLVISLSDLANDPRVDRQLTALRSRHTVIAAGLAPPGEQVEFVDLRTPAARQPNETMRRAVSVGLLVAHARADRVFWRDPVNTVAVHRLAQVKPDLVLANDLSALPLACRVAGEAPIVFDAHELAISEHAHALWWRLLMVPYVDGLLRTYLPRVRVMTTVSAGIADIYRQRYGVEATVMTSAPPRALLTPSEVGDKIRMIHHGVPLRERRLELMIEATESLDDRFELDLMLTPGEARYMEKLRKRVAGARRVRIVEPVPQRAIVQTCNQFDVGLVFFPPSNENLRHVLPNKLFEFIQARLALAVSPSPEMARIVDRYQCGVVAPDFSAEGLAHALRNLTPERVGDFKRRSDVAANELNAERNAEILGTLVDQALSA